MLGDRIATLRREKGMSQAQLAERLTISPSAVGMYEQGRREPSVELLVAMAKEFQVSTDYLLTGKPASDTETGIEQQLLRRLEEAQHRLHRRGDPLSRHELGVLLAAMLLEP